MGAGRGVGPDPPLKNHKAIGFLSNPAPSPLKNRQATKYSMLSYHRPASETLFNDGPLMVVIGSPIPSSTTNTLSELDPP